MNSDYKSALDKIHLEQNKKEEMKQLFRKNNMRRKINFIKRQLLLQHVWHLLLVLASLEIIRLQQIASLVFLLG